MADKLPKLLMIIGPTAVGKSRVAVACAASLGAIAVIGADSQQCYAECIIGTAQPTLHEQNGVPHYGIGGRSPMLRATAAEFARDAAAWIDTIAARGAVPVVVGGTGLYVRALLYGLAPTPPADPVVRAELTAQLAADGAAALHQHLQSIDAELAAAIHPHHTTRLLRALEVWRVTGVSPRVWHAQHPTTTLRYPVCAVGLTAPRPWLRDRIALRTTQQLSDGWIAEVEALRVRYGDEVPVLRAIGYREIVRWLDDGGSMDALHAQIVQSTVHYTKRQMTYFRHQLPIAHWIDVTATADVAADITKLWTFSQASD